jgi:hypothetical protein
MLNNITNFFNLIKTGMVKTQLESTDLIPTGTRDGGYGGSYKPTMIKYSDLASQILSGVPPLTIGTTPIVSGSVGKLLYEGAGNVLNESPIFNIDPLTGFLGAGTSTPQYAIDMQFNTLGFYSAPNYYAYLGLNNGSFYLNSYSDFIFGTSSVGNGLIIKQNGNILINTGTDAGFKLDVNGTARVQGDLWATSTLDSAQSSLGQLIFNSSIVSGYTGVDFWANFNLNTNAKTVASGWSYGINLGRYGNFFSIDYIAPNTTNRTRLITIPSTGNLLINTTTDAGFRLDVNGTARVQTQLSVGNTGDFTLSGTSSVVAKGITRPPGNGNGLIFSENMQAAQIAFQFVGSGTTNGSSKAFLNSSGKSVFNINIGLGNPNTNGVDASVLLLDGIHNVTQFSNTTIRGIYYNPTLTSMIGVIAHYAWHSTSGRFKIEGLPTSPTGLTAGELWNDGGTLKIV